MYVCTIANEPKVGFKLLLINYTLPESFVLAIVPGSYSLLPYFLLLYSESLRSLLPINFLFFLFTVHKHDFFKISDGLNSEPWPVYSTICSTIT